MATLLSSYIPSQLFVFWVCPRHAVITWVLSFLAITNYTYHLCLECNERFIYRTLAANISVATLK